MRRARSGWLAAVVAPALATIVGCSLSLEGFTGADETPDASTGDDASADAPATTPPPLPPPPPEGVDAGLDGSDGACPSGRGPDMVRVPAGFCIDSTEVTRTQYSAFLASNPSTGAQAAVCTWNTTFVPGSGWPPAVAQGDFPVVSVDWCDAFAFCAWAGKHLCGAIGGGPVADTSFATATASQWMNACTQAGAHAYGYGDAYDPDKCNGGINDGGPEGGNIVAVKTFPGCQSYPGVYDLLGNADEWEDSCNGTTGSTDLCHLRGEGYGEGTALRCDAPEAHARSNVQDDQGIRCCAE